MTPSASTLSPSRSIGDTTMASNEMADAPASAPSAANPMSTESSDAPVLMGVWEVTSSMPTFVRTEYAVTSAAYPWVIYYGPQTKENAEAWIKAVEEDDGIRPGVFILVERQVSDWTKSGA